MELFHRKKDYRVLWDELENRLVVTVSMKDSFHDMEVEVVFQYPDLVIVSIQPLVNQTPYPICPTALVQISKCVGLQVKPGLAFLLERQIGGKEGCTHLTNLILDACHISVQGLLAKKCMEMGNPQQPYPPEEKIAFLEQHRLSVRNTCVAYSVQSPKFEASN
jgi:hypothetical protein